LSEGQQTYVISRNPMFSTNLQGNSSLMIILPADSLAP